MLKTIRNTFAGAGMVAMATVGPMTGNTVADNVSMNVASSSQVTPIQYATNADDSATEWRNENPYGIAFAVYLGTESKYSPEQLAEVLTKVAKQGGVDEVAFYFEQNDMPSHGFGLYYDRHFDGPLNMANIIPKTQDAANYQKTTAKLLQNTAFDLQN